MKAGFPVEIRRANAENASAVALVLRRAFAEFEPLYTKKGYAATTPEAETIVIRMQEGPLWLAVMEQQIVGTTSAVLQETGLYVRGMAVLPKARGFGVGRRLLEEVEAFAMANGCKRLFLNTTPFLRRAIRLYEDFGFRATDRQPHDLYGTPLFSMEKILAQRG
jgi:putative acetyltransferase